MGPNPMPATEPPKPESTVPASQPESAAASIDATCVIGWNTATTRPR
ncbi:MULTISPECIES: hypothetical protein [Streptomyces]|nr:MULTISPECIES: hypothetical protein [unclassified Streptomyces]